VLVAIQHSQIQKPVLSLTIQRAIVQGRIWTASVGIIDEAIRPEAPTGASGLIWLSGNFASIWIPWLLGTS